MLQRTDTALDAALKPGQVRHMRAQIRVDWNKDESFTGPASKLDDEIVEIQMDDQADAGLPDEVNGVSSVASTQLTFTIKGYDPDSGLDIWELFSPFTFESPYRKRDLSGAAVEFDMITATPTGDKVTRQFTGWVRSVEPDRTEGTVTVTCANHLHIQGNRITLPRWARHVPNQPQLPGLDTWDIPDEDRMENAPTSFAWLWQYVMRQCGAIDGPAYRDGTIWFSSGYGGMIPEVCAWSDYQAGRSFQRQGLVQYRWAGNWIADDGSRGIGVWPEIGFQTPWADSYSGSTQPYFDSYSQGGALVQIVPTPPNPRYLNFGSYVHMDGGADAGSFVKLDVYLDSWQYLLGPFTPPGMTEANMASVKFTVGPATTTLVIRGTGDASPTRTLTTATPAGVLTGGMYVSYEVDWMNPANSRIWFNDTPATVTSSGTLSTYPTTWGDAGYGADKSKCRVWLRHARYALAEVWTASAAHTGNRRQTWSNGPYNRRDFAIVHGKVADGGPVSDIKGHNLTNPIPAVTYIPNRQDVDAWDLLNEMCHAAGASLFIDAFGGTRIIPQTALRNIESKLTQPMPTITDDSVDGVTWRTGYDAVRSSLRYGARTARAIQDIGFRAENAKQFMAPPPTSPDLFRETTYPISTPAETISLAAGQITQWASGVPIEAWGLWGFHAANIQGGSDFPPDLVHCNTFVYDLGRQDLYRLAIDNYDPNALFLALATNQDTPGAAGEEINAPALLVEGLVRIIDPPLYETMGTPGRQLDLPLSDFHSAPWTFQRTYGDLLTRLSQVVPRCDDLTWAGDPRIEMFDLVRIQDSRRRVAIGEVIGRRVTFSASAGYQQTLSVRMLTAPGDWLLGVSGMSELGVTTILG